VSSATIDATAACRDREADLHALHDGQLSPRRRRKLERHLADCAGCRRERTRLEAIGGILRSESARLGEPDLWARLRPGLARIDAEIAAAPPSPWARLGEAWRRRVWATPVGVGALAAGVAALALALWPAAPAPNKVVRVLDAKGHAVVVLSDEADATIIWVMDDDAPSGEGEGDSAAL
jgi:anti-sigma factor RsiW